MSTSETGNLRAGDVPVAVKTRPPGHAADASEPARRLRILGAIAGIAGPALLIAYFIAPVLAGFPSGKVPAGRLIAYTDAHQLLFHAAGWLQGSGALLSIVFLLILLQFSGRRGTVAGSVTLMGCATLLSVVLIEAVMAEVLPTAAANGDHAAVSTMFELLNGVFARIYPLAPAPLVFAGIGFALAGTKTLPRVFSRSAVVISGLFLIAGIAAMFGTAGLIFAEVMSVMEAIWIPAAAIALARTARAGRIPAMAGHEPAGS